MIRFATVNDLRQRWSAAPPEGMMDEQLQTRLDDASVWLRIQYPMIPDSPDGLLSEALRIVACSVVRRAENTADLEGYQSFSEAAGPFTETVRTHGDGSNFYLTKQEKELIEQALSGGSGSAGSFEAVG